MQAHSLPYIIRTIPNTEPTIQWRYVYALNKLGRVNETERAIHHWRQWRSYQICAEEFKKQPEMDIYFRMRDDGLFVRPFSPSHLVQNHKQSRRNSGVLLLRRSVSHVYVSACARWHGVSDKIAIFFDKSSALHVLMNTARIYEERYNELTCPRKGHCKYTFQATNPETFLLQAWRYLNVKIDVIDPLSLPYATGTDTGVGFCFTDFTRQLGECVQIYQVVYKNDMRTC